MNRFLPLLKREWLQHRRGWLIVMLAPAALVLLASLFGDVHVNVESDGETVVRRVPEVLLVGLGSILGLAVATMMLTWISSLFQSPGLARRDQQDRSIEFWLSLPTSHTASIGATLLMHLVLIPWLALAVGMGGGLLVSLLTVAKAAGVGAWFGLPWASILTATIALMLRLALGLLLCTLWLSPLLLLTMAASAWLKRWGLPFVVATIGGGGLVLDKFYDWPIVWQALQALGQRASQALIAADRVGSQRTVKLFEAGTDMLPFVQAVPGWAVHDAGLALQALFSPAFLLAFALGAAGFALLVLRRQRGA